MTTLGFVRADETPTLASASLRPDPRGMYHGAGPLTADEPVDQLQQLILTRLRELGDESGPMSAREAARRAEGLMSLETFRLLARGRGSRHRGRITDRVAEGLALALQVPVARVYEAAGVPSPGRRWDLPERFDRVPPAQRQLLEELAAALLNSYDQGYRDALKGGPNGDTQTADTP